MDPEKNQEELDELLSGIRDLIEEDTQPQEEPFMDPEEYMEAEIPLQEPVPAPVPEEPVQTEDEPFQNKRWTDRQKVPRHVAKLQNHQEEAYAKWLKEQEEKGEQPPPVFEEEMPQKHKKRGGAADHDADGVPVKKKRKGRVALWLCLILLVLTAAVVVTAVWILPRQPKATVDRARISGMSTIVVAGVDDTLAQTDMIMLVTVDEPGERLNIISLPRDTRVGDLYLGAVYGLAGGGQEGITQLKSAVKECIGFLPDGCIVMGPETTKSFIDAMGGVKFNIPRDVTVGSMELRAGTRILDGEEAYALLRLRDEEQPLDLERAQLQQQFLYAMLHQCADFGTALDGAELLQIMTQQTVTDLDIRNFMWLARAVFGADFGNVYMQTLPGQWDEVSGDYVLDVQLVQQTVNGYCCPYIGGISMEAP